MGLRIATLGLMDADSAEHKCYQCISSSDNQEDCESSDLDKLKPFIKPCPVLQEGTFKGAHAKGCRKIIQTVESKKSTIRECAYSGEVVDGQKKTGNWGINMYYYQCENTVILMPVLVNSLWAMVIYQGHYHFGRKVHIDGQKWSKNRSHYLVHSL
ncbi:unnamed protein product [Haemonchus placei]|uniref:Protein quiver n=1 Tax=Haemonchus placei TaxID=6290 RepID=A0A0N4X8P8_HAEPC|nr:unnamed protein product [Haemonchus placei]